MLSVFHHYVFWTHAHTHTQTHKPTRFCLHFKIRWHFSTDLLLIVNEMYSRNINIINSVLEKRSFFFSFLNPSGKSFITVEVKGSWMLQKCLWTDVLCRKGTDRKPRWQEGIELQIPEARPQPGLCTEAHCLRTGAALGLCIGPSCLHPLGLLWKSCVMLPVSSHLGNPYQRKRSSRTSVLLWGAEMATAHIAGGIWQLEIEHSPKDEKNGLTNEWKEMTDFIFLDTTTSDQTAMSSDIFLIPSAIPFLFLAINVVMLQN